MSYHSPYDAFIFEKYSFDLSTRTAEFHYSFDGERSFSERVVFSEVDALENPNQSVLQNALQLAFYLVGTSYYKAFPTKKVIFKTAQPDEAQAKFLQEVYINGLSQFIFENGLTPQDIARFSGGSIRKNAAPCSGQGVLVLQSGGKDSLLMTRILEEQGTEYNPMYVSSTNSHPSILNKLQSKSRVTQRILDSAALKKAVAEGGLNGHVPVTYIIESYALIDAILHGENKVLISIGAEGAEAHEYVGDLAINHQWSKTWEAEQLLSKYIAHYVSEDILVGSPLRMLSELKIAELFVEKCWAEFGHSFSSCNLANYQQGEDNTELRWCGECPKCANSYLLFAPFVEPEDLKSLFAGQDLFAKEGLTQTFKGLLGIEGVMKPFECVGEVDELRLAYHMAKLRSSDYRLSFDVPDSSFNYELLQQSNKLLNLSLL